MKHWLELCSSAFFFFFCKLVTAKLAQRVTTGLCCFKSSLVLVRVETREAAVGLDGGREGGGGEKGEKGRWGFLETRGFVRFFPIKEIIPVK